MNGKEEIIKRFMNNVKGKKFNQVESGHDGAEGHWLEVQMGLKPNGSNTPDIFGYEMKKDTATKTTFGDWSPDFSIWGRKQPLQQSLKISRDEFLQYFGKPNPLKGNRFSWSGEPIPKIDRFNKFGQTLTVVPLDDIVIKYSFSKDIRSDKKTTLPDFLQRDDLILAVWSGSILKLKLERKFNDKGWFKCFKNQMGEYTHIGFGKPINYPNWINLVKKGVVYFDCGMYEGNLRPYAQWRADNNYWNSLIVDKY